MAKIIWASDFMLKSTSQARIARNLLPRIQERSDHDVVQYAVSGLDSTMPFPLNGVKIYGNSRQGGDLGVRDFPLVNQMESADFWLLDFDSWAVGTHLQQMDLRYVVHPSIDHDPVSRDWESVLSDATEIVPDSVFGERVLSNALGSESDADKLHEPIAPGVDTDIFSPTNGTTQGVPSVEEDTFAVGLFAYNQGTRVKPVRQLRAFEGFVAENDLRDEAMVYLFTANRGQGTYDLQTAVDRLDLGGCAQFVNRGIHRWGMNDQQLAQLYNTCDVMLNVTGGEGFSLPILHAFATETPVIASGYSSHPEVLSGEAAEIRHDDENVSEFVETERGWLVPVWDDEPTLGRDSWRRTFNVRHIEGALAHAYHNPDLRAEKGVAARDFAHGYSWDRITDAWITYFDGLEDRLFETDDSGIEWGKVSSEKGGVEALGGDRTDE